MVKILLLVVCIERQVLFNEYLEKLLQRVKKNKLFYFVDKYGRNINDKVDVENGFNDFFVNVGPKLAENIHCCDNGTSVLDYLNSRNDKSMFLEPVVEQKVLNIVKNALIKLH